MNADLKKGVTDSVREGTASPALVSCEPSGWWRQAEHWAGPVLWPLADHLGTLRDLAAYDPYGVPGQETSVASHRTFDAFGNLVDETNPAVDILFAFTARDRDVETGLQYHRARYYDPTPGRWLSEDPIGFDGDPGNLVRYVRNDPLRSADRSGLEPEWDWATYPPTTSLSISFETDWYTTVAGSWNSFWSSDDIRYDVKPNWSEGNAKLETLIKDGTKLDYVIIAGHGGPGHLGPFNTNTIGNVNTDEYKFLQKLGTLLKPDAKVELRGCQVAKGRTGVQFIRDMAKLLGAEVIAWDDWYAGTPHGQEWHADAGGKIWVAGNNGPYEGSLIWKIHTGNKKP